MQSEELCNIDFVKQKLYLEVPSVDELHYRQEWMKDSRDVHQHEFEEPHGNERTGNAAGHVDDVVV